MNSEWRTSTAGGRKWQFFGGALWVAGCPEVVFIFRQGPAFFLYFFLLPIAFGQAIGWASTFRQSILRGGQCHFRCYCVNVSMAILPPCPSVEPSRVVFAVAAANRIGSSYISQQFPFGHIVRSRLCMEYLCEL